VSATCTGSQIANHPEACYTTNVAQLELRSTQLSTRELSRLGHEIYERKLKAKLEPEHDGEYVVIHVVNSDFAVDTDEHRAYQAMRRKYPDDVFFFARIGAHAVEHFGGRGIP
jgi:hypothetical protein